MADSRKGCYRKSGKPRQGTEEDRAHHKSEKAFRTAAALASVEQSLDKLNISACKNPKAFKL